MSNTAAEKDTAPAATTNGKPPPKPNGRIATLEKEVAELRWCFAELIHGLKVAALQQKILQSPQIQSQLQQLQADFTQQMAAEMEGA